MMHILLFPNQIPSNHLCRNLSTFTPGLASAFLPSTPHIPHLSSSFQSIITVAKNARHFCVLVLQACDQIHGCASCDKTISSPKSPTEAWTFWSLLLCPVAFSFHPCMYVSSFSLTISFFLISMFLVTYPASGSVITYLFSFPSLAVSF